MLLFTGSIFQFEDLNPKYLVSNDSENDDTSVQGDSPRGIPIAAKTAEKAGETIQIEIISVVY